MMDHYHHQASFHNNKRSLINIQLNCWLSNYHWVVCSSTRWFADVGQNDAYLGGIHKLQIRCLYVVCYFRLTRGFFFSTKFCLPLESVLSFEFGLAMSVKTQCMDILGIFQNEMDWLSSRSTTLCRLFISVYLYDSRSILLFRWQSVEKSRAF